MACAVSKVSVTNIQNVCISLVLVRILEVCVSDKDGVHVGACVLVEFVVAGDHDDSNLHVTQDAQLIRFLQQSGFTLAEGDLS